MRCWGVRAPEQPQRAHWIAVPTANCTARSTCPLAARLPTATMASTPPTLGTKTRATKWRERPSACVAPSRDPSSASAQRATPRVRTAVSISSSVSLGLGLELSTAPELGAALGWHGRIDAAPVSAAAAAAPTPGPASARAAPTSALTLLRLQLRCLETRWTCVVVLQTSITA